jgi:potassium efflux system protein
MNRMYRLGFTLLLLGFFSILNAQTTPDSTTRRRDSARARRAREIESLFGDTARLSASDYQLMIERQFVALTNIINSSEDSTTNDHLRAELLDVDSAVSLIRDNVLHNRNALNLRNLQVFRILLQNLQTDLKVYRARLDSSERGLERLRSDMKPLAADTILRQVWRDSLLRRQFSGQLREVRQSFGLAIARLRARLNEVNVLQTRTSANLIAVNRLQEQVNSLLATSAARVFGKEVPYLWEKDQSKLSDTARNSVAKAYEGESKAVRFYFRKTSHKRLLLLLIGALFLAWVYRNLRTLKKSGDSWPSERFDYLSSGYLIASLAVMFCMAPLFDLYAPSAYIESMQFLLVIILTIICWRKWPRALFLSWVIMAMLFVCFSFTHHLTNPSLLQRFLLIGLNVLSIIFGTRFLRGIRGHLRLQGFIRFIVILHNVMNGLSLICNITGRFGLAQMLGNAAIFSFMQAVGLSVFSSIWTEAIELQLVAGRRRSGSVQNPDFGPVLVSFRRILLVVVLLLWLIVFTTNLNIYTWVLQQITGFLAAPRQIGEASFTFGGILLFFFIIFIAHMLQKQVGYFFGDVDAEDLPDNKGRRSRLLITKLLLLCVGYLLAVAASGVPVDKITIVLGALGVGIGLGLQNIVNNFVSGIILIFDRPLQIGDLVEVGAHSGRVREIGVRSSTLLTSDGAEVIIPNGDILSGKIVNWTHTNSQRRMEIDLEVSGSDDRGFVSLTLLNAIQNSELLSTDRKPQVRIVRLLENGFGLKLFVWCRDAAKTGEAQSELLLLLHEYLPQHGLTLSGHA